MKGETLYNLHRESVGKDAKYYRKWDQLSADSQAVWKRTAAGVNKLQPLQTKDGTRPKTRP